MERIMALIVTVIVLFSLTFCTNNQQPQAKNEAPPEQIDETELPQFKFETESHDFGDILEGEKVSFTYKFTNVGKSDLVISQAKASCGCTVPKWSRKPIEPEMQGEIEVVFDSSNRNGTQYKEVTLFANTQPNKVVLSFKANIKPAE